ncbi:MAG: FAD-dependent monooxygenase [Rhodomicrobium sp.]
MKPYDAAVIGGGVAGPALAAELARAGRSVILFEKEKAAHDKVCGEFISHEGVRYLHRLGVSLEGLGALPIRYVRLARYADAVTDELPFEAQSLSRRVLDETLLQLASTAGAEIQRGIRVKGLEKDGNAWAVHLEDKESVAAKAIFLATGKHDLKDWKRTRGQHPECIAFKAYWRLTADQAAELSGHVELILFPGGYAGLQEVEGGRANLCLIVRKDIYAARYGSWESLLSGMRERCPHLKDRLDGAASLMDKPLAISGLPFGHVAWESGGVWRLGDQAATIPSFSGDGMSIALHSARRAAKGYLRGESPETYQQSLARQLSAQLHRATIISRMLVSETGQGLAMTGAGIFPFVLPVSAGLTRIPARARSELGGGGAGA